MRSTTRIGLVGALSALFVLGASGAAIAAPRAVPTKKYAKTVCGAYTDLKKKVSAFTDKYNADTSSDPATFQTEVGTLTQGLLDDITALEARIKKVYPDVDDGKKITKLFVKNFDEITAQISSALKKFKAADPRGVSFQADVSTFEVAVNLLDTKTSDPFSKIDDQDLLGALDKEKSCSDVVTIYGR
ncbi:MAG TPA: hypothetical protein VIH82_01445 [Acidimicrobiia bacterium]